MTSARVVPGDDVTVIECPCGMRAQLDSRMASYMAEATLNAHLRACDGTPAARERRLAALAAECSRRGMAVMTTT